MKANERLTSDDADHEAFVDAFIVLDISRIIDENDFEQMKAFVFALVENVSFEIVTIYVLTATWLVIDPVGCDTVNSYWGERIKSCMAIEKPYRKCILWSSISTVVNVIERQTSANFYLNSSRTNYLSNIEKYSI